MKNKPLAAIDIGTNTFRLLIAKVLRDAHKKNNYNINEICSERIITRLGEGIHESGLIKKEALTKGITALKKFSDTISRHNVYKTSVIATSALREAKNRDEFLKKAKEATGLDIEIISGKEEARKTSLGMLLGIPMPKTALMADIGGGSTELIFIGQRKPELVHSLNLGVVYLADKYMKNDPPLKKDLGHMDRHISMEIGTIVRPFSELITPRHCSAKRSGHSSRLSESPEVTKLPGIVPTLRDGAGKTVFVGTAGTVTTLSAISQHLAKFEHNKIHNSKLTIEEIRNIFSKISTITAKERVKYHPFEPERLDIIVPGTIILLKILETFGFKEVIVSNYGLREGILLELYRKTKT